MEVRAEGSRRGFRNSVRRETDSRYLLGPLTASTKNATVQTRVASDGQDRRPRSREPRASALEMTSLRDLLDAKLLKERAGVARLHPAAGVASLHPVEQEESTLSPGSSAWGRGLVHREGTRAVEGSSRPSPAPVSGCGVTFGAEHRVPPPSGRSNKSPLVDAAKAPAKTGAPKAPIQLGSSHSPRRGTSRAYCGRECPPRFSDAGGLPQVAQAARRPGFSRPGLVG